MCQYACNNNVNHDYNGRSEQNSCKYMSHLHYDAVSSRYIWHLYPVVEQLRRSTAAHRGRAHSHSGIADCSCRGFLHALNKASKFPLLSLPILPAADIVVISVAAAIHRHSLLLIYYLWFYYLPCSKHQKWPLSRHRCFTFLQGVSSEHTTLVRLCEC